MDERTPLTDLALDREIQAALDVDPSAEFVARVRQRIAIEPAPALWSRRSAALAAAAGLVLAAALWRVPGREVLQGPQEAVARPAVSGAALGTDASPPTVPSPPPVARPAAGRAPAPVTVRAAVNAPAVEDPFANVVIAENERKALRWLGASTRVELPEPADITLSADREPGERPALSPVAFEVPEMDRPVFEPVGLE